MRRFGSSNVAFRRTLDRDYSLDGAKATYAGVGMKLLYFLAMTVLGAVLGIFLGIANPTALAVLIAISGISTFILSLMSMMSDKLCKVTGPLYCLMEGALVGIISLATYNMFEGAVMMALFSTIAVFSVVAFLYLTNIVKVGSGFTRFLLIFSVGFIISQLIFLLLSALAGIDYSGVVVLVSIVVAFEFCGISNNRETNNQSNNNNYLFGFIILMICRLFRHTISHFHF